MSIVTGNARWTDMAFYIIGAAIAGGLLAAVFGTIDYAATPAGTRAKRIGGLHGGGNVIVVLGLAQASGCGGTTWPLQALLPTAVHSQVER